MQHVQDRSGKHNGKRTIDEAEDKKVLVKDGTDVNEILNVLLADMRG